MTKQEVMNYVTETPHNVNRNILGQKLDEFQRNVSWNDLKDKPFYAETEVILEQQTVDGFVDEFGIGSAFVDLPPVKVIGGEKYAVFWDGEKYELTADEGDAGVSLAFGSNILDPFMLVSYTDYLRIATTDINTSHEIGIYRETVHKLDAKYLPDGVGSVEPDMVIDIAGGLDKAVIEHEDVTITSGTVSAVFEKLWAGTPVDVRVRGIHTAGSYAAKADEVKAFARFYGGYLYIGYIIHHGWTGSILCKDIMIMEDGMIDAVRNRTVALTNA